MEVIKDVERTTIEAALTGSRQLAVKALALHPLVQSTRTARRIFDAYRSASRRSQGRFPRERRRRLRRAGLPGPDLHGSRRDPAARAGALRERASCARPAAWPSSPIGAGPARAVDRPGLGRSATTWPASTCGAARGRAASSGPAASLDRTAGHRHPARRRRPGDGHLRPGDMSVPRDVAALDPRAIVLSPPRPSPPPEGEALYATVGDADARPTAPASRRAASGADVAPRQRARGAPADRRGRSARRRARRSPTRTRSAVVTLGAAGAIGIEDGGDPSTPTAPPSPRSTRPAPATCSPPPTCGPTWRARRSKQRLRWAVLYASLSVGEATAPGRRRSRAAAARARGDAAGLGRMPGTRNQYRAGGSMKLRSRRRAARARGRSPPAAERRAAAAPTRARGRPAASHDGRQPAFAKAGKVTLTVWDQEVRGGQRADQAAQRGVPEVPERHDQARRRSRSPT